MTILVTCGFQQTWCEFVQDRLSSMGIQTPVPAERTSYSPQVLTEKMCASHGLSKDPGTDISQIEPGKTWHIAAADLFMANAETPAWGWAGRQNIHFLDFWRGFDPMCRFILIYGSPAQSLACGLANEEYQPGDIQAHLNQWVSFHGQMLRFYQANRDHSLLIKIDQFEGTAASVTERLAADMKLETRRLNDSAMREISPTLALIADKLLAANELERALYAELESSADLPSNEMEDKVSIPQDAYGEFLNARAASASLQEKATEIDTLQAQISELNQNLSDAETAIEEGSNSENLENQNELLMLQLNQVQEELELYFKKYQDLQTESGGRSDKSANGTLETTKSNVAGATIADTVIDMRSYVNGSGWHSPEQAGRWAGPDRVSTLKLPALGSDRHRIEIKIVDAMKLDIAKNIHITFDGKPLASSTQILSELTGALAPLRRIRANLQKADKPFPVTIIATLPEDQTRSQTGEHTLTLTCPETISPSQFGQPDTRSLSICVERIKLVRVT